MKRKTNLFYFDGNDSNFLTFSNYTEHLTGNFLSTDYKLFPSRFLCLNIPSLNNIENKQLFIKQYLCGYYENKLAFLRDKLAENKIDIDTNLLYLNYLLDAIYKYELDNNIVDNEKVDFNNIFIGDITEQNYNGTFTDIICTIEHFNKLTFSISNIIENNNESNKYNYDNNINYLYNWNISDNYIGPNNYIDIKPLFDTIENLDENTLYQYSLNSNFDTLFVKNINEISELKFNVIIPLYDCVNLNVNTNTTIVMELEEIDLSLDNNDCARNVPYGIWFANETITLSRDNNTGYTPSWSLLIGAQFKPFPNSNSLVSDPYNTNTAEAYSTFAEVLNKQTNIINLINKYNVIISDLNNKIKDLENNLAKLCDLTYINELQNKMEELINKFSIIDNNIGDQWLIKNKIN